MEYDKISLQKGADITCPISQNQTLDTGHNFYSQKDSKISFNVKEREDKDRPSSTQ